jgi:hypothetical protein
MFKTLKNRSATSDLIDGRLYCVFGEFTAPGGGSFSSNQYASGAGPSGSDALHCYFRGGNYISPIIVYPTLESPFQITKATDYKPIGIEGTFEFYFKMTQPGMLLTIDASDFGIDIEANRIQYYAVRDPDNNDIPLLTINRSHVYNTWTHVAITYVSGVWTWYLNGSVLATLTGLAGLRDFSPASILFYSSASGSLFLQGLKATNRLLYPAPFSPPPFIEL